jgi:uncharacterized protein YcbX
LSSHARIAALHVYPIKGCRPLSPKRVRVETTGFATAGVGDREWMAVDREGRFVTQREFPRLALIELSTGNGALHLSAPAMPPLALPLATPAMAARDVVVWRSAVRGIDAGDAAAQWLTAWIGAELRLLRFDRSLPRLCNPEYAGDSGAHTMFADGYPVLVIGSASLADLNARLAASGSPPLPMNRFRPNLVLDGLDPYAEDHIDTITAGDIVLRCVKPCVRCQVTTTNQATAEVGLEPLRTLGSYRMDERLEGVTFGINAIVSAGGELAADADVRYDYRF